MHGALFCRAAPEAVCAQATSSVPNPVPRAAHFLANMSASASSSAASMAARMAHQAPALPPLALAPEPAPGQQGAIAVPLVPPAEDGPTMLPSKFGGSIIAWQGHNYHFRRQLRDGKKVWRCALHNGEHFPGTCTTTLQGMRTVCELRTGHSHPAAPDAQTAVVVRKRLRESATAVRTARETATHLIATTILAHGANGRRF